MILLVLALATTLQADEPFYFDPRIGSPAGGDVIRFVVNLPSLDFRASTPRVFFGGIASPRVTVTDSKTLTAVTPPHAEGVVDVELRLNTNSYTTFFKFGYARNRTALLIPVAVETPGAFGSKWTTDIWVHNDSDAPVNLMSEVCSFLGAVYPCGNPMVVAEHRTMRIPPRVTGSSSPEMYLFPPNDARDRLHFNIRVRNTAVANDPGTEIPIASSSDFRNERLVITNVPVKSGLRSVLRVYDQERVIGVSMSVRIYDMDSGALLMRRDTGFRPAVSDNPLWFSIGFFDLLSDPALRGHDTVRIEIEEPDASLWALLTLTDNITQRVTVFTSQ